MLVNKVPDSFVWNQCTSHHLKEPFPIRNDSLKFLCSVGGVEMAADTHRSVSLTNANPRISFLRVDIAQIICAKKPSNCMMANRGS